MRLTVKDAEKRGLFPTQVRFNGITLSNCIMADEEEGLVEVYDYDLFFKHRNVFDYMPTKFMEGDVFILLGN